MENILHQATHWISDRSAVDNSHLGHNVIIINDGTNKVLFGTALRAYHADNGILTGSVRSDLRSRGVASFGWSGLVKGGAFDGHFGDEGGYGRREG